MTSKKWEILDKKVLSKYPPWLELISETVLLPDGQQISNYYRVEQRDYVVIFALTEKNQVIALWHYKHGPRKETLGLPAGYINDGESPREAAERELLEETGYAAEAWRHLGSFCVDGNRGCGNAHIFFAQELTFVKEPDPDDLEKINLEFIDLDRINKVLFDGSVLTLGAVAAISLGIIAQNNL